MSTSLTTSLLGRLDQLERELAQAQTCAQNALATARRRNSRGRLASFAAGFLGAVVLVGGLLAAGLPDSFAVVRTKRLEIVDDQNRVLGLFAATADGSQLDVWNGTGANVARLSSASRGGDLSIWNAEGKAALGAFVGQEGGRFEVYDSGGRTMGRVSAARSGGELVLNTPVGKTGVIARSDDRGGGIAACDALGRPLAELSVTSNGGLLLVADQNGQAVGKVNSTERGGAISLFDGRGGAAFSAGADVGGGSFTLASADGKPIVTAAAGELGGGAFEVRNAGGAAVVSASAGDQGSGRFSVSTADGNRGVTMAATATGYSLSILEMARRVLLLEGNAGGGRIELTDPAGKAATVLGVDQSSKCGAIALRSANGQEVARLSADEKGNGNVTVYNQAGTERKALNVR